MTSLDPFVLELLVSRICHDLVSPVGAVNNGVEFYEDMGEEAGEEAIKLIAHSAGQAQIKLKCFRLAYGAGGREVSVGFDDVRDVFTGWLADSRFELDWPLDNLPGDPRQGVPKVLLNTLLLAEECGPGGTISVRPAEKGVTVGVTGDSVAFRDGAEAAFEGGMPVQNLTPRIVHAYVLKALADSFDISVACEKTQSGLVFTLTY